jgi:WD40 repeat protein
MDDEDDEADDDDDQFAYFGIGATANGERVRLGFSGDGRLLAAASHARGRVVVLDAATGAIVLDVNERPPGAVWNTGWAGAVALDAGGARLASGVREGGASRVVVRDVASGDVLVTAAPSGLRHVVGLAFSPDGRTLAVAGRTDGDQVSIWSLAVDGAEVGRTPSYGLPVYDAPDGAVAWSGAGPRALFRGRDERSLLIGPAGGRPLCEVPYASGEAGLALTPRALVAATQHGVQAWLLPDPVGAAAG